MALLCCQKACLFLACRGRDCRFRRLAYRGKSRHDHRLLSAGRYSWSEFQLGSAFPICLDCLVLIVRDFSSYRDPLLASLLGRKPSAALDVWEVTAFAPELLIRLGTKVSSAHSFLSVFLGVRCPLQGGRHMSADSGRGSVCKQMHKIHHFDQVRL